MHRLLFLMFSIAVSLGLTGCWGNAAKQAELQQKINTFQADNLNTQTFLLQMLKTLKDSKANNIFKITAHPGKPITIDAASVEINQPVDLVAIFNSEAFKRDWGAMFPPTKNGFDAFIAALGTIETVVGNDVPWLANSITQVAKATGISFTGNNNSVAERESSIDNSDRSNTEIDNSDNSSEVVAPEFPVGP